MRRVLIGGVVALVSAVLLAGPAQATVFSWRDEGGTYHFTNRPDEVPAGPLDGYRASTEAPPPQPAAAECASDPPAAPADDPPGTYEQGVEAGLRLGAEQIRIAGEIAQQAQPEPVAPPPQVIYVQQPAPVVVDVVPYDTGCGGRGCGYGYGYGYGYPFNAWVVTTPGLFSRPFSRHGRFAGNHRFGGRAFGGGGGRGLGMHGMHGAGFWGRR
jgi:hypothetical protein